MDVDSFIWSVSRFGCEDVEWTHLALEIFQWRVLINMIMKFWDLDQLSDYRLLKKEMP